MFELSDKPINPQKLRLQTQNNSCGGFVCFEGWVRNHNQNRQVLELSYESHPKLAHEQGHKIIQEAHNKFAIKHAHCSHRVGTLKIGDMAVWVGVSAAHRDAAFKACRYILDEVKSRVPIWKNEQYSDGESAWVEPQQ